MQNIKEKYDLVVIGAGPGGTPVATEYAKLNHEKSIALIDATGELGGECLFQGCIPSKILEASAKHIKDLKSLKEFGVEIKDAHYQLIWDKVKQRKDKILNQRTKTAKKIAQSVGNIDIIQGMASFESENSVKITHKNKQTTIVQFEKALIATGSSSITPVYKGDAAKEVMTNNKFFHDMELPNSLSIVGGGAIAVEFAQILSTFGVKINLFVRGNDILTNLDEGAREYIIKTLQNSDNINILLNATIQEINYKNQDLEITYIQDNVSKKLLCNKVLSAIGKRANIDSLSLERANVEYDKGGVITSKSLQTTNKNIFANGDVVKGFPKFAHTAQYAAHIVAQNLFLEHNFFHPYFHKNSWVLFSMPNVAMAGISEEDAKSQGLDILVDKFEFNTEAKSQIENEDFGYIKFIVERGSKKIIGISILHEEASNIGGEAAIIVAKELTLKDLIDTIHPHPTISEGFVMLAKKMMGDIMLEKLDNPIVKTLLKIERFL